MFAKTVLKSQIWGMKTWDIYIDTVHAVLILCENNLGHLSCDWHYFVKTVLKVVMFELFSVLPALPQFPCDLFMHISYLVLTLSAQIIKSS